MRYCHSCGARLARDNPGTHCAPCQHKTHDLTRRPPDVPPGFWDTDHMRDALASRHMGSVIHAYRHHPHHGRPLPQELVAGWLGIAQAQLSRAEHGPPITDLTKLTYWAQTLRIPQRCLWFDLPGQRRDTPQTAEQDRLGGGGPFPAGDAMMVWLITTIEGKPVLIPVRMSRRKVLAAGGAGMLGALDGLLDPDEFARVQAAVVTPTRADLATARHLEALLGHYRRLDDQLGPRDLLTPVQSTLDLVEHLRKAARPDVRQALLSLSAQYEQLIGALWKSSGNHAMAERAYDLATARATEADDQPLVRYVLTCKSDQALEEGQHDTALRLAQAAQAGERRVTPASAAFAALKEARAQALRARPNECKRKLGEAAGLLAGDTANNRAYEPPWIYWFEEKTLLAGRGICLTDLGEADEAIEVFDRVLPAIPAELATYRAHCLLYSARAHAANNDPEQAGVVGQEAARISIATGSGLILQKLRGLHAQLSKAHKDVRTVQELGDLLRPPSASSGTGGAA